MIDLHSHLLPGIDDGPADEAGSIALARAAVDAGIAAMAATPHIDHAHGVVVSELRDRRARLQARLAAEGVPLEILQGGEITAPRLMELSPDELRALTLGGGRCILLECPFSPAGSLFDHVVFRAQSQGLDVLLAHPERSPDFAGRPGRVASMVERRVLVQVTAASLAGKFGRTVQRATLDLLEAGLVHVIATDAHGAASRGPGMEEAVSAAAGRFHGFEEDLEYWTVRTPAAIVGTEAVEPPPPLEPRRFGPFGGRLARRRRS